MELNCIGFSYTTGQLHECSVKRRAELHESSVARGSVIWGLNYMSV